MSVSARILCFSSGIVISVMPRVIPDAVAKSKPRRLMRSAVSAVIAWPYSR